MSEQDALSAPPTTDPVSTKLPSRKHVDKTEYLRRFAQRTQLNAKRQARRLKRLQKNKSGIRLLPGGNVTGPVAADLPRTGTAKPMTSFDVERFKAFCGQALTKKVKKPKAA